MCNKFMIFFKSHVSWIYVVRQVCAYAAFVAVVEVHHDKQHQEDQAEDAVTTEHLHSTYLTDAKTFTLKVFFNVNTMTKTYLKGVILFQKSTLYH
jgi:hypothetical protein